MKHRIHYFIHYIPSSILVIVLWSYIFSFTEVIGALWYPAILKGNVFPGIHDTSVRVLISFIIIIFTTTVIYFPSELSLPLVYFICAIRISDYFFGGFLIAPLLWIVPVVVCTFSMSRYHALRHYQPEQEETITDVQVFD